MAPFVRVVVPVSLNENAGSAKHVRRLREKQSSERWSVYFAQRTYALSKYWQGGTRDGDDIDGKIVDTIN